VHLSKYEKSLVNSKEVKSKTIGTIS